MREGGRFGSLYSKLLLIFIIFGLIASGLLSLISLRHNNVRMAELRSAVFEADRLGKSDQEINQTLIDLRNYVTHHMNTSLSPSGEVSNEAPIQLPYKYYRDTVRYWSDNIQKISSDLLAEFKQIQSGFEIEDYIISVRLNCIVDQTNNIDAMPAPPRLSKLFYTYNFTSPTWSPDIAGWSIVFFVIFYIALVLRLLF